MNQHEIYSLFIFIILLFIFSILLSKTTSSIGNQRQVLSFKGMIISYIFYILFDFRMIAPTFINNMPYSIRIIHSSTCFMLITLVCFFWFQYVVATVNERLKHEKLWNILSLVPVLTNFIILYTPINKYAYTLSPNLQFGPLLLTVTLIDHIYLLAALAVSVYGFIHTHNKTERKQYSFMMLFIIFYMAGGILSGVLITEPVIELSIVPAILIIFVNLQDSKINTDALTGLNNRRCIDDYMSNAVTHASVNNPVTVMMLDLNYFKTINDTYGHAEGDNALVVFSNAIKKNIKGTNLFAGRWGGDEFIIVAHKDEIPDNFRGHIEEDLETSFMNEEMKSRISFSMGTFICTAPNMSVRAILRNTDKDLYTSKEEAHNANAY